MKTPSTFPWRLAAALILVGCASGEAPEPPETAAQETPMRQFSAKLSPDAKFQLMELEPGENPIFSAMVALDGFLTPERRERLEQLGCTVVTASPDLPAGDLVTAAVPASALEALAALDFITQIELSRPLSPGDEEANDEPSQPKGVP